MIQLFLFCSMACYIFPNTMAIQLPCDLQNAAALLVYGWIENEMIVIFELQQTNC